MSPCAKAQILWDGVNAERFGDLCRRTFGLCDEDRPCPPSDEGWILLVSSHRGLPAAQLNRASEA